MLDLPSSDSSACVHSPEWLQIGQGNWVCNCHFAVRIPWKSIFITGKNEMKYDAKSECQPKDRIFVKKSIVKGFPPGTYELLKSFSKVFWKSFTYPFFFCSDSSGKIIQMIFRIHPNGLSETSECFWKTIRIIWKII